MGFTRGFHNRRQEPRDPRLPPGQYDTGSLWPVLTAEVTPKISTASWAFSVEGLVERPTIWTWYEIQALPPSSYDGDIHCVTTWSKLGVTFKGVSVDTLLATAVPLPVATHALAFCYTAQSSTVPPIALGGLGVRRPAPSHRSRGTGPAPGPAPVLLEKRKVGGGASPPGPRPTRLLGTQRLPQPRRPLGRTALRRRLTVYEPDGGHSAGETWLDSSRPSMLTITRRMPCGTAASGW